MDDDFGSFAAASNPATSSTNGTFAAFGDFSAGGTSGGSADNGVNAFADFGSFSGGGGGGMVKTEGATSALGGSFAAFQTSTSQSQAAAPVSNNLAQSAAVNAEDDNISFGDFGDFSSATTAVQEIPAKTSGRSSGRASLAGLVGSIPAMPDLDSLSDMSSTHDSFSFADGSASIDSSQPRATSYALASSVRSAASIMTSVSEVRGDQQVSSTGQAVATSDDGFAGFTSVSATNTFDDFGPLSALSADTDLARSNNIGGSSNSMGGFGDFSGRTSPPPNNQASVTGSGRGGDDFGDFANFGAASSASPATPPVVSENSLTPGGGIDFSGFASSSDRQGSESLAPVQSLPSATPRHTLPTQAVNSTAGSFSSYSVATNSGNPPSDNSRSIGDVSGATSGRPADDGDFAGFGSFSMAPSASDSGSGPKPTAAASSFGDFGSFSDQDGAPVLSAAATPKDTSSVASIAPADGLGAFGSFGAPSAPGDGFGEFGGDSNSGPSPASASSNMGAPTKLSRAASDDFGDEFGTFSGASAKASTDSMKTPATAAAGHDDFGDFGSFGGNDGSSSNTGFATATTASFGTSGTIVGTAPTADDDDDFGDFGDFGDSSAASTSGNAFSAFSSSTNRPSSTFQSAPAATSSGGGDDGFGGFGSFSSSTTAGASAFAAAPASAPVQIQPPAAAAVPKAFGSYREALKTCFSAGTAPCPSPLQQPTVLRSTLASGGPWAELGRVGERPLATFSKMASQIRCDFLGALKVEASLIGVQSGQHQMPAFAAGLGLLQPSGSPAIPHTSDALLPAADDPFSLNPARAVSPLDLFGGSNTPNFPRDSVGDAPIDQAVSGSALLDLAFENAPSPVGGSSNVKSIITDPLLQSDLMGLDLTFTAEKSVEDHTPPFTAAALSPLGPPKPKELSPEMERMIESLPDLSFMLSRVLMFPAVLTSSS